METIQFRVRNSTKGTIRYYEVVPQGESAKIETLYIKKHTLGLSQDDGAEKAPAQIAMTLEW